MSVSQVRSSQGNITAFVLAATLLIALVTVYGLHKNLQDPAFDDAKEATSKAWHWTKQKATSLKPEGTGSSGVDKQRIYEEEKARMEARGRIVFDECVERCKANRPFVPMSDGKGGMINYAHEACRDECERLLGR